MRKRVFGGGRRAYVEVADVGVGFLDDVGLGVRGCKHVVRVSRGKRLQLAPTS